MSLPDGFSWIEKPLLAGMARPGSLEELVGLRQNGIELLISLTEDPPPRSWINEAGLFLLHVPIVDLTAPTPEQLEQIVSTIQKAHGQKRGVGVHCGAGLGRTGTVLAAYLVSQGMSGKNAIARIRRLRPNSIETEEQELSIRDYENGRREAS
jgi:atypical dual specificity phosphatase